MGGLSRGTIADAGTPIRSGYIAKAGCISSLVGGSCRLQASITPIPILAPVKLSGRHVQGD